MTDKKTNYVNVNLRILNGIFANKLIPIPTSKKWASTVGIITEESSKKGNLILVNIETFERVFKDPEFPIQVTRRWLEDLNITIEVEAKPLMAEEASLSIAPVGSFSIGEVKGEEGLEAHEESAPSGAVTFGS